ncbi:MAG: response regulator transcription factor [Bacteroidales bacterium]|nr:response regulator transcription factor [Bacteroidales bacterium]
MIKVAIVDDHKLVREGIGLLINQLDEVEVVAEFSNAQYWLSSLNAHEYDVSLVDVDMPGMSGITAMKEAVSMQPGLKVIMLTMHNDVNYFRDAFINGARGFVLKDMSVSDLSQAIREVHNNNTYFSTEFLNTLATGLKDETSRLDSQSVKDIKLTTPELNLITNICKGYTNKELAESLFLSVKTIESQKTRLMRKIDAKNNAGIIVWAIKNQVVDI